MSKKVVRSPSYPSLSLGEAIDAVGKIDARYRSAAVDRLDAAKLIGFSSQSGPANQALASLAAYGLLERAGKGDTRVTELARAILHPESNEERLESLEVAAGSPPLFERLRERFEGISIPPEDGVVTTLNRMNFNPNVVRRVAKAFLETCQYIGEQGVRDSRSGSPLEDRESSSLETGQAPDDETKAVVGDWIQWESQGALQFPEPRRIRAVSDDGDWVFVEGSVTGIPRQETSIERKGESLPPAPSPTLALEPREFEWLRSQVGRNTSIRLMVTGELGSKEVERLIRVLQTQHEVLLEDEEEDVATAEQQK